MNETIEKYDLPDLCVASNSSPSKCSECRKRLEPGEAAGCFTPDRHHLTEPEQQILCYLKYWQIIIYNNTNLEM